MDEKQTPPVIEVSETSDQTGYGRLNPVVAARLAVHNRMFELLMEIMYTQTKTLTSLTAARTLGMTISFKLYQLKQWYRKLCSGCRTSGCSDRDTYDYTNTTPVVAQIDVFENSLTTEVS
ncbi:hypothetical protein Sjap_011323 [Stephania japonica]|uniref:Uncharacterized protein n=1 Tax=Stephania japonica TaxID=461633 RepID=A0AAP0JB65_9MAGN